MTPCVLLAGFWYAVAVIRGKPDWTLWGILVLALVLRLGWGLTRPADDRSVDALPDQREYLSIAENLLAGRGAHFFDHRFEQVVYAYRLPGYPLFLAACGCEVRVARAAQAIIDASTVLAVYLLARRIGKPGANSRRAQLAAALIVAVNPLLIYFSGLILSETLFISLLAWGMLGLLRWQKSWFSWWPGAILLGISIYIRPGAWLLAPVLALASGGLNWHGIRRAVVMAMLMGIMLFPWAWRNKKVLGTWVWTSTNSGITAYDGWNPAATGASDQSFVRFMPELRRMSETDRSRYLQSLAWQFVKQHPVRSGQLALSKLGRLWSPVPLSEQYSSRGYWFVGLLYTIPFDLLVLTGLITGQISRSAKVYLMLPAAYLSVIHMASVGSLRYLLPALGPMGVIAGLVFGSWPPGRDDARAG